MNPALSFGFPEKPDMSFKLSGAHAYPSEVLRTMTGVCGPNNLGGSVTASIRAGITRAIVVSLYKNLQNNLGQIILSTLVQIASNLSFIHSDLSISILPFL